MPTLNRKLPFAAFAALLILTGAMFTFAAFAPASADPISLNFTKIECGFSRW